MEYIAYLHKDGKSDFGVSFLDFPGCVTAGRTLGEARRLAGEALALHIAGMAEDGEVKGAVAFLVTVDLERTVRVNITARESQIDAIDRKARGRDDAVGVYGAVGVGEGGEEEWGRK